MLGYVVLFSNSYEGLKYLSDDQNVIEGTYSYLMYYLPGFLMYGLSDLNRKYLNSFSQNFVPMIGFMISVFFHPIWGSYLS
jgi:Na+-driven multidrug efflux pump